MRIKKLEISGFKSFAERARLQFGEGITGVVGPNGCGKSNIVDAIRWCMGEMSAKHLRGRGMQDVIFAGSDNHGPLGMAEVTLTFDNDGSQGHLPNYSEIAVTRRLFRDGSSEYLINKVPVRLRDVTDLFLGTGVGTRAYSIIEQGRIGFIVNSRPEDRRSLIEEVAGITKFKARKKAAERRMESTEQNLLRVNDVVSELERQLATLGRQAKKAEKYKELRAEQRDLELHQASMHVLRLGVTERVHRSERARIEAEMNANHAGLLEAEAALEAEGTRLMEEDRRLQLAQAEVAELESSHATLLRDLEHWRQQLQQAKQQGEQANAESEAAKGRIAQLGEERAQLQSDSEELEKLAQADAVSLDEARRAVEALQEQLAILDEELEVLRRDALEHVQGAAKQRTLAANLEQKRQDTDARRHKDSQEHDSLLPRQAQLQTRHEELQRRAGALAEQLQGDQERAAAYKAELPSLRQQCKDSQKALHQRKDELGQRRNRLRSLEEIVRRLDGYSDGVRNLMGPKAKQQGVEGLCGLVTEILEVPPECERAVEAVLGDKLQYLLVEDSASASQAVAYLRKQSGGRSGFIPKQLSTRQGAQSAPSGEGVLGAALELVKVAGDQAAVAAYLLADVYVVDSLATALRLAEAAPGATYVSQDGDVVDAHGVVAGGSANGAGLLANRREIRELQQAVAELEKKLAEQTQAHEALEERRAQLEHDMAVLDKEIHAAQLEAMAVGKDHDAAGHELKRVTDRLATLVLALAEGQEALSQLEQDAAAALQAATEAEAGHQDVAWRVAELQERRQIQAGQLKQQQEQLTSIKVRMASQEEKAASAQAALKRLQQSAAEQQQRVERNEEAGAAASAKAAQLGEQMATGEARALQEGEHLQVTRNGYADARATYEQERAAQMERERTIKEQRRGGELLHEALSACKMELQKVELERQTLLANVLERHDVSLLMVVGDYHLRPQPTQAEQQRVRELDKSLKNMGSINLTAIDECAEVETRYEFLVKQRDDLQGALGSLKSAITSINKASRERFREAFDLVNEMFQKVYPRLFRGGVARLELTQSDDLLEAGVDIIAQPPGKKLQSVQLLSGGEKALTATALVFAIFLIKPSPFCILDEVDAPLDEANVNRFNEMLREISAVSQFIVITHNKNTMLQADRLYGITMEEPGMSKVVTVDLEGRGKEEAA